MPSDVLGLLPTSSDEGEFEMILSAQTIRGLCHPPKIQGIRPMIEPFHIRSVSNGMTFGLGPAGYDVRIAEEVRLPFGGFALASTMERFVIPDDVIAFAMDKSSWARRGLSLFNTVLEPGWEGFLTLELSNAGLTWMTIAAGTPIAQIVFQRLDEPTDSPYRGRYNNQERGPQPARDATEGDR